MAENLERCVMLKAGERYSFCTCGHSKKLPFCDNTHRQINEERGTSYKSLKVIHDKDVTIEVYSSNWKKSYMERRK